ncbi:MAG: hypothetical protein V4534_02660 [Myxococcota bacterium]
MKTKKILVVIGCLLFALGGASPLQAKAVNSKPKDTYSQKIWDWIKEHKIISTTIAAAAGAAWMLKKSVKQQKEPQPDSDTTTNDQPSNDQPSEHDGSQDEQTADNNKPPTVRPSRHNGYEAEEINEWFQIFGDFAKEIPLLRVHDLSIRPDPASQSDGAATAGNSSQADEETDDEGISPTRIISDRPESSPAPNAPQAAGAPENQLVPSDDMVYYVSHPLIDRPLYGPRVTLPRHKPHDVRETNKKKALQ